jgi:predicted dehydrogenase
MAIEAGRGDRRARRIRLGMIGGGEGAFIGAVHRLAARMDDHYEFVAGALSSTPGKARRSGRALGLDPVRAYPDYATMLAAEAERADGIEAVAIVTPNHVHAPAAAACLAAGLHVICDKPLAASLAEGRRLTKLAARHRRVFAVTYNYTGYPMVREARQRVRDGLLGEIRVVQVEYAQDWLTEPLEATGQKQAEWRTDPARSGEGGCIGDIGTHAFQLAHFVTGVAPQSLLADLSTFVPGRRVVFASTMAVGEKCISATLATIELLSSGTGTNLIFTHQGAFFEGADGPEMREEGWQKLLKRLTAEFAQ